MLFTHLRRPLRTYEDERKCDTTFDDLDDDKWYAISVDYLKPYKNMNEQLIVSGTVVINGLIERCEGKCDDLEELNVNLCVEYGLND
ncbi:unnamed protein product, partial [Didymodactylos carnosus]